jgi:hypothetical protein
MANLGGSNAQPSSQVEGTDRGIGMSMPGAGAAKLLSRSARWSLAARTSAVQSYRQLVRDQTGDSLSPGSAGVIVGMVPWDRAALERVIDRFIDQLDDAGAGARVLAGRGPARVILFSMALAGTALALEVMRRRRRHSRSGGQLRVHPGAAREDLFGFPELPGSWTSRPT